VNLSAAIHTRWAAYAALEAALPAARFFTGRIPQGTANPCARLSIPGGVSGKLSDKARERAVQVRIIHWVAESAYGTGQDIQDAIEEAFDNYDVALEDSTLVNLRHDNSFHLQDEEPTSKLWQFVTQFTATIQKDRTL
jgi:hypothetical protein